MLSAVFFKRVSFLGEERRDTNQIYLFVRQFGVIMMLGNRRLLKYFAMLPATAGFGLLPVRLLWYSRLKRIL